MSHRGAAHGAVYLELRAFRRRAAQATERKSSLRLRRASRNVLLSFRTRACAHENMFYNATKERMNTSHLVRTRAVARHAHEFGCRMWSSFSSHAVMVMLRVRMSAQLKRRSHLYESSAVSLGGSSSGGTSAPPLITF